ncbi:uracil-DNA glycosylase [Desulforhopalus sp. IMCC35007]|uniref:uracil-DNA glycosylase n=1 Tax=Desulforhopalus sp. IMCC35007 TaxID=2569543 RepID=UPI0010ADE8A7|nr:uracil-DNA glycosylase [Desulforhopalus sp. IMCC35007]TKB11178.1 uracil-DNA glycosylase [Desulforhopalus sp. IMCC35007]
MEKSLLWEESVPLMIKGVHKVLLNKAFSPEKNSVPVYPERKDVFAAMRQTSLEATKVVILGQDPYFNAHPGKGPEAHGLSFSVREGIPIPPSLRNILKEVNQSIYGGKQVSINSDLTRWAEQGVLLLNASLTVMARKPNSHADLGWHHLTDDIIKTISEHRQHVVFMLWGSFAQKKRDLIDTSRHLILATSHPSPLSAHRGFLGSGVFLRCNDYLKKNGIQPIEW